MFVKIPHLSKYTKQRILEKTVLTSTRAAIVNTNKERHDFFHQFGNEVDKSKQSSTFLLRRVSNQNF